MEVYAEAVGDCIVCGKDATGSLYWLSMTQEQWEGIRPFIEEITPVSPHSGVKLVGNTFFVSEYCKPFCGAQCVQEHYRQLAASNLKKGN